MVPLTGLEPVLNRFRWILSAIPYSYSSVRWQPQAASIYDGIAPYSWHIIRILNDNVRVSTETSLEKANSHLKRFDADFDELRGYLSGYARQGLPDKEEISCRAENTMKRIGASTTML